MTVLRHPVERTLSQYDYVRRDKSNGPLHEIVKDMSLEEYLRDEMVQERTVRDLQTRWLSAAVQPDDPDDLVPARDCGIDRAKANLERFGFVGLTERFEDSLRLLCYTFHWKPIRTFETVNASKARPLRADLPSRLIDEILSLTENDLHLYEYARGLFERRFSAMTDELLAESFERRGTPLQAREEPLRLEGDLPWDGEGWYPPQRDEAGVIYRWTGPQRFSNLDLPPLSGHTLIRIGISGWISTRILDSLKLSVNGCRIPFERHAGDGCVVLAGTLGASALQPDACPQLVLEVAETLRPCDVTHGQNPDQRQLGVAIAWIEVSPAR